MKKRIIALLAAAAMTLSLMAGCAKDEAPEDKPDQENPGVNDADQQKPEGDSEPAEEKDTFTVAISYMPDNLAPNTAIGCVVHTCNPSSLETETGRSLGV